MNPFVVSHNFNQAIGLLQQLEDRFEDMSPAMSSIAALMADETEQAFADQADPVTADPWQELSEDYLKRNPKRRGGQILQSSGSLAASVTTDSGDFWAQIGSNKPYAAIHQMGGTDDMAPGPAAIPARAYLGISELGKSDIVDILKRYLAE